MPDLHIYREGVVPMTGRELHSHTTPKFDFPSSVSLEEVLRPFNIVNILMKGNVDNKLWIPLCHAWMGHRGTMIKESSYCEEVQRIVRLSISYSMKFLMVTAKNTES